MSDFIQNISSDELVQLSRSPVMKLMIELSKESDNEIIDPERTEQVMRWTRSFKPEDPQYNAPEAIKADLRHLGFFNDDGSLKWDVVEVAKEFLATHRDKKPNYTILWRHLNVHLGRVHPEKANADYTAYNELVAELIDSDTSNITLTKAIVEADNDGLAVPTFPLCKADRIQTMVKSFAGISEAEMEKELSAMDFNWFPPDSVASAIRKILKNQNYGLGEEEFNAWLEDHGKPSTKRQLKGFFGNRNKVQTLKELGILNEDDQWSENGFQKFQTIANEAYENGISSSLEWLRFELHQRHRADEPMPFEWTLMNDQLTDTEIHRARRIASIALSGGILRDKVEVGKAISSAQYEILRKVGTWVHGQTQIDQWPSLKWIGLLSRQNGINWDNWIQICSFVYDKLDQTPDPELIIDWRAGIVTFEGRGRYQEAPATTINGKKIGRNEPCPCQSGKKYKKCCGR